MPMALEKSSEMSPLSRHISIRPGTPMKASIVDLRDKTKDILQALERNESVTVLYHGKVRGIIKPAGERSSAKVKDHEFFGMNRKPEGTVLEELEKLRKTRHDL